MQVHAPSPAGTAQKASGIRTGLVAWHREVCGTQWTARAGAGDDVCFVGSRIRPQLGHGSVDVVAFDDDFMLLAMRGRFHDGFAYQGDVDGWTRIHFRKAARTLMKFEGVAASELNGPLCQVLHHPVGLQDREWVEGRAGLDWVTLFMRPQLLVERFRLDSVRLSDPVRRLGYGADEFLLQNWALSAEMLRAVDQLLGSSYCGDLRRVHLEAKALELVCAMSQVLAERGGQSCRVRLQPRDVEALHEVRRILSRSPTERPSIEVLSRRVGLNRNKLAYGFKHLFDQTISDFCLETRLQSAWDLLRETSLPIAIVAERVGYAQAAAFSTAFRQRFGITPRQVRRG